ncbi:hypothetical protein E3N88_10035 [Mikania micrantha]|uniref:Uncharacterized protein n=1 Tax=Mikania micrantha TaxID=192012 RepID=A0A5N6PBB0_9ASTR|nr:hypothetical protein E3N88_10035 [Mikania micrantha]
MDFGSVVVSLSVAFTEVVVAWSPNMVVWLREVVVVWPPDMVVVWPVDMVVVWPPKVAAVGNETRGNSDGQMATLVTSHPVFTVFHKPSSDSTLTPPPHLLVLPFPVVIRTRQPPDHQICSLQTQLPATVPFNLASTFHSTPLLKDFCGTDEDDDNHLTIGDWYKYGQDKGMSLEKQNNTSKETKNDTKDTSMEKSAIYRAAQMDLRERERCAEIVAAQQFEKAEKCTRVLHLVEKNLNDNISESKAIIDSWGFHPNPPPPPPATTGPIDVKQHRNRGNAGGNIAIAASIAVDHQTLDSPVNDSAETDLHSNVCTSKLDQVTKVSDSIDEDRENLEAIEDD